jgi:hypothetical protein
MNIEYKDVDEVTSGSTFDETIDFLLGYNNSDPTKIKRFTNLFQTLANLVTSLSSSSTDAQYPSAKAVYDKIVEQTTGALTYCGTWDASGGLYPTSGGSGTAGVIAKGDMFIISVAGTLGGELLAIGDFIIANEDLPAQTSSKWDSVNTNIGYTPENTANKVTAVSSSSTDTQYPSAKCLYDDYAPKFTGISGTRIVKDNFNVDQEVTIVNGIITSWEEA